MDKDLINNNENNNELKEREQRILYLESILADYSRELYENNKEILTKNEYEELFNEYEILINEKAPKKNEKNFWDEVNLWIILYGLFQLIFCLPWFLYYLIGINSLPLFIKWFANSGVNPNVVIVMALYIVPFLNLMLSWILYVYLVKGINNKKLYIYIWVMQTILTIGGGIYLYFDLLRPNF